MKEGRGDWTEGGREVMKMSEKGQGNDVRTSGVYIPTTGCEEVSDFWKNCDTCLLSLAI